MTNGTTSTGPEQTERRVIERARWAEVSFLISLCIYAVMAVFAREYRYFSWDIGLDQAIQSISIPGFRPLMVIVSIFGSGWVPFALVIGACVALILWRLRLESVICMVEAAAGAGMNVLVKLLVGRPRPVEPLVNVTTRVTRESFPSGHVVFFVEFFGFLLFLTYVLSRPGAFRRATYAVLGALVLLVGVSRVYLGAHWPSDVVGAYFAGGVWLMLTIEIYRRLKWRGSD